MKKRKAVHGFTLIELIIVMALFSLIMYSVVSLLDPVTKFFVRSSNFQDTTACVDNMKTSIEGNLKYANRVRVYSGFAPYKYDNATGSLTNGNTYDYKKSDYIASDKLQKHVQNFYDEFFANRRFMECAGHIYALVFDNENIVSDEEIKKFDTFSEYTDNQLNRGKIVLYDFEFNNYNGDDPIADSSNYDALMPNFNTSCENPKVWYVNQKLYGNFDYKFRLGTSDDFETTTTATAASVTSSFAFPFFNNALRAFAADTTTTSLTSATSPSAVQFKPQDCTIEIRMDELVKNRDTGMLNRQPASTRYFSSFSMKNVLDSSSKYQYSSGDYKIQDGGSKYQMNNTFISRYEPCVVNATNDFEGFYFIFTNPDAISNHVDESYIATVQSLYPTQIPAAKTIPTP